ncbi:hypothetical protein ACOME3_005462 [Neoechinorhynchus agilis]
MYWRFQVFNALITVSIFLFRFSDAYYIHYPPNDIRIDQRSLGDYLSQYLPASRTPDWTPDQDDPVYRNLLMIPPPLNAPVIETSNHNFDVKDFYPADSARNYRKYVEIAQDPYANSYDPLYKDKEHGPNLLPDWMAK